MKVCQIIDEYFPPEKGYTGPYFYCKELQRLGHEVVVLCGRREGEKEVEIQNNIKIYRSPFVYKWGNRIHSIAFAFFILRQMVFHDNFSIIHVYYFSMSPIIHAFLCLTKKGKHVCDIRSIPIKRITSGVLLRKISAYTSDVLIVLDCEIFKKIFGSQNRSVFYELPLGVDVNKFKLKLSDEECCRIRNELGFFNQEIVCVSIGSMDTTRRQDELITGFAMALTKNPNLRLVLIGGGDKKEDLERIVNELNLQGKILFLGFIKHEEIPRYLNAFDIGITYIPIKLYNVQPPTKTIEYLTAGLSVIATETTGNRRFNSDKIPFELIKDNPKALSEAIGKISCNLKVHGKKRVLFDDVAHHDWSYIAQNKLIPAYKTITGS